MAPLEISDDAFSETLASLDSAINVIRKGNADWIRWGGQLLVGLLILGVIYVTWCANVLVASLHDVDHRETLRHNRFTRYNLSCGQPGWDTGVWDVPGTGREMVLVDAPEEIEAREREADEMEAQDGEETPIQINRARSASAPEPRISALDLDA
ncbi:MAG: hypothetical protein Q9227_006425 [Pyrenula ochraceoflavens]